jgi:hypothetical protein
METVIDIDGQIVTKLIDRFNYTEYVNSKGEYHRLGGPAIMSLSGIKEYWVEGKRHFTKGPAYIHPSGTIQYWVNDKLHNIDGPAITWSNGTKEYWVDGTEYTEEQYPQAVLTYNLKQLVG